MQARAACHQLDEHCLVSRVKIEHQVKFTRMHATQLDLGICNPHAVRPERLRTLKDATSGPIKNTRSTSACLLSSPWQEVLLLASLHSSADHSGCGWCMQSYQITSYCYEVLCCACRKPQMMLAPAWPFPWTAPLSILRHCSWAQAFATHHLCAKWRL